MAGLSETFEGSKADDFPYGKQPSYVHKYAEAKRYLDDEVHPLVTQLANVINEGFLTDHGPEHIRTVIQRAGVLLDTLQQKSLTFYEEFFLLMAIQVHDVGNKFGRDNHELMSNVELRRFGQTGWDNRELSTIWNIAQAHGGYTPSGDKDKINDLKPKASGLDGKTIRPQLLAAILRLADELADDRSRATRYEAGEVRALIASELYHAYAYALHSVSVDGKTSSITLEYELDETTARRTYLKGADQIYLIDEIKQRSLKTFLELKYCMRFMSQWGFNISRVRVEIEFTHTSDWGNELHAPIAYTWEETGYPIAPTDTATICVGTLPDGAEVKRRIDDQLKQE